MVNWSEARLAKQTFRLLFATCGCLAALAGQDAAAPVRSATTSVAPAASGPDELKRQTRVTVETNGVPAGVTTNGVAPKQKSFAWKFSCDGWDGIRLGLTRKTLLAEFVPGVTNLEQRRWLRSWASPARAPMVIGCGLKKDG